MSCLLHPVHILHVRPCTPAIVQQTQLSRIAATHATAPKQCHLQRHQLSPTRNELTELQEIQSKLGFRHLDPAASTGQNTYISPLHGCSLYRGL